MKLLKKTFAISALVAGLALIPSNVFATKIPAYITDNDHRLNNHIYVYKIEGSKVFYHFYDSPFNGNDGVFTSSGDDLEITDFLTSPEVGKIYYDIDPSPDNNIYELDPKASVLSEIEDEVSKNGQIMFVFEEENDSYNLAIYEDGKLVAIDSMYKSQLQAKGITLELGKYYYNASIQPDGFEPVLDDELNYTYKFISGDNQVFEQGKIPGYTFKIDGNDAEFTHLEIWQNGKIKLELARDYDYNVVKGSTVINFTKAGLAKLNALTVGTYDVEANYVYEKAVGKLFIKPVSSNADPSDNEATPARKDNIKNPDTYDGIAIWVALGLLSAAGIVAAVVYRKKLNS